MARYRLDCADCGLTVFTAVAIFPPAADLLSAVSTEVLPDIVPVSLARMPDVHSAQET